MDVHESTAQIASFLQELYATFLPEIPDNCCILAVTVLVFYDYFLTLSQEVQYVWKSRSSSASIIFYLNRYLILALSLIDLVGFFPLNSPAIMWYAVWAAFSCLRVFAISGRDWRTAVFTLIFGLVPCVTTMYGMIRTSYYVSFPDGVCIAQMAFSTATADKYATYLMVLQIPLVIATRVCLIVSDIIVIAATWYYMSRVELSAQAPSSVATILVRDGTLYFILLLAMNVLHISLFITSVFQCTVDFIVRITAVLVTRYLLNLRHFRSSQKDILDSVESYTMHASSDNSFSPRAEATLSTISSSSSTTGSSTEQYSLGSFRSTAGTWGVKDVSRVKLEDIAETDLEEEVQSGDEMELTEISSFSAPSDGRTSETTRHAELSDV
ncbi:uncharacterized protein LAESUDRAFT_751848 [Laetiporus sulphureus 93-53]|uniref:DUF6533 domain-containing protein n=1 Tax=Laetiporus sulphureus 93-53 TaxID=1314785 RepID=A0A165CML8_9APHY|nr:uncharacterized protein LAESUDRAFT_751848 [Laetiporus sulphureus 93-53]KZT03085.1 hypothetical protein LAESUDRAFT_751848 [Laetiporus sulphureus 93-53]